MVSALILALDDPIMTGTEGEHPRLSRAYRRLWWASGVDSIGTGIFTAALPLLAITITRDPRHVALLSAVAYLPWLLLSLPVGALLDRRDRVALMWRSQVIQAVLAGVIAAIAASGQLGIPTLALLAFLRGGCDVVLGNAAQAVLPDLVAKPLLPKANGQQQAITTLGLQFVGPPVGSLLFAVGVAVPFGTDAASFVLSAALLATLPRGDRSRRKHPPIRSTIVDGLRWLKRHRLLRTLALLLGINTFCGHLASVTLVLLATQTLGLDMSDYGFLLGSAAIGGLLASLVSSLVVAKVGVLPALLAALTTSVFVYLGIGMSPNASVLVALLAVNGFATALWTIVTVSLRQQIVPAELLGRVNSSYRMLGRGLIPLGALAGGLVAHAFGLRAPYPIGGVLRGIALLIALPALWRAWPG